MEVIRTRQGSTGSRSAWLRRCRMVILLILLIVGTVIVYPSLISNPTLLSVNQGPSLLSHSQGPSLLSHSQGPSSPGHGKDPSSPGHGKDPSSLGKVQVMYGNDTNEHTGPVTVSGA